MELVKLFPLIQMLEMNNCPHLKRVLAEVENDGGKGFIPHNIVPSKFS